MFLLEFQKYKLPIKTGAKLRLKEPKGSFFYVLKIKI